MTVSHLVRDLVRSDTNIFIHDRLLSLSGAALVVGPDVEVNEEEEVGGEETASEEGGVFLARAGAKRRHVGEVGGGEVLVGYVRRVVRKGKDFHQITGTHMQSTRRRGR